MDRNRRLVLLAGADGAPATAEAAAGVGADVAEALAPEAGAFVADTDYSDSGDADTDEALVERARAGDDDALHLLLTRYRGFARARARRYFLVGADTDDVVQEAMIGLYKAVRDYRPELDTSFRGFAELCVNRQVITAVKSATRHKHGPLNSYVSFARPLPASDNAERYLADVLPASPVHDPANLVVSAERVRALQEHVGTALSDLEVEVLRLYVEGMSYTEIALLLQRQAKSIDNALQRIKRKLDRHLRDQAAAEAG